MNGERPTILIIDDSPSNIEVLRHMLIDHYKVKVATSGAVGLRIAAKAPPPDLILLDIVMPEMDGYEVCRQLKENPETAKVPVVFVTGTASDEEKLKGLSLGACGFIMKPLDFQMVLDTVAEKLRTR